MMHKIKLPRMLKYKQIPEIVSNEIIPYDDGYETRLSDCREHCERKIEQYLNALRSLAQYGPDEYEIEVDDEWNELYIYEKRK
jgi:hypothetical protein